MVRRSDDLKILATSALLLIDAMVLHEVLTRRLEKIDTLSTIRSKTNVKKSLEDNWRLILKEDYEPVFEIALRILENLPASPQVNEALRKLVEVAYDIASSPVLLKHDLFGRVYHQLLLGKLTKYYATYYTSIPAARLLARLLVNLPSNLNLGEVPPKFDDEDLKVVDFACGSGTLLSAVYKELNLRHRLEADTPKIPELHTYLIEEGLWGFDVLQHAIHLASTTLFLHEPFQPVSRARTYALKLGAISDKEIYLGSLDFLENDKLLPTMLLTGVKTGATRISVTEKEIESESLPRFHLCIMNPPFTRSVGGNLLFGGLPSHERKILQKKLSEILRKKGLSGIGQAGLGAVFVFLANQYLKEGGRLGLVLPKAVLMGVSWRKVREMLLDQYHIEYVISSFEGPDNWNFSENTSLSEVLLVARKLKKSEGEDSESSGYTIFVNLWKKPRNEIESIAVGSQLLEMYSNPKLFDITNSNATAVSLRLRGKKIGEAYSAKITDVDFGYLTFFAQAELNRIVALLRDGVLYLPREGIVGNIPVAPLSKFIDDIGPDVRQVHDAFKLDDTGIYNAFWGHESEKVLTIEQNPNAKLNPKSKKVKVARELYKKSGRLLIVERARLTTYRVLSIVTTENVLSNVWWPILTTDEYAKMLSVWLNSTYGLLLLLSIAEVTEGPWVKFKKDHLWNLPVLDLSKLNGEQKSELIDLYKKVSKKTFEPLPSEFSNPKVRKTIDDKLNDIILNKSVCLDDIYEMLSRDPMITSQPL